MRVPFNDLKLQYAALRPDMDAAIRLLTRQLEG